MPKRPNVSSQRTESRDGIAGSAPIQIKIGRRTVYVTPRAQAHPIAGRQPATKMLLWPASTLFTSICALSASRSPVVIAASASRSAFALASGSGIRSTRDPTTVVINGKRAANISVTPNSRSGAIRAIGTIV